MRMKLSVSYISLLMAEEGLPHFKIGRAVRFRVKEVAAWLQKKEQAVNSEDLIQRRNKFNQRCILGRIECIDLLPRAPRISRVYVWDQKLQTSTVLLILENRS